MATLAESLTHERQDPTWKAFEGLKKLLDNVSIIRRFWSMGGGGIDIKVYDKRSLGSTDVDARDNITVLGEGYERYEITPYDIKVYGRPQLESKLGLIQILDSGDFDPQVENLILLGTISFAQNPMAYGRIINSITQILTRPAVVNS